MVTVKSNINKGYISLTNDKGYSKTFTYWLKSNGYVWDDKAKKWFTQYNVRKYFEAQRKFGSRYVDVQAKETTDIVKNVNIDTKIANCDLSVRVKNCFRAAEIETIQDLVGFHPNDLLKFRNFGKLCLTEVYEFMVENGISWDKEKEKLLESEKLLKEKEKERLNSASVIINGSERNVDRLSELLDGTNICKISDQDYLLTINIELKYNGVLVPASALKSFTDAEMRIILMQFINLENKRK